MHTSSYQEIPGGIEGSAFKSFLSDHAQDHQTWYEVSLDAGLFIDNLPITDFDEQDAWLERHMQMHTQVAEQWLTEAPPDLQHWDLRDQESFELFNDAHYAEHVRMNIIMGLT